MRALADTSALLALHQRRDQYHARAVEIARRHRLTGGRLLVTTLVLGEFHTHVLQGWGPGPARAALTALLDDPDLEPVGASPELVHDAATTWLARYADQPFTLVDAVSFEVMRQERLTHAFAFDHHFEVAGFRLLG